MADDASFVPPPLTPAAPKPAHVPDELVYDFDMFADVGILDRCHGRIEEIVREAPLIFWTPRRDGRWVLISHEAVFEASRDWETFSNESFDPEQLAAIKAAMPPGAPHILRMAPATVDPPDHAKYRIPLTGVFAPKVINAMRDSIRALARELLAAIAPNGRCDFMSAVAEPMPVQVFLKMLGLPLERWPEYRRVVKETMQGGGSAAEGMHRLQYIASIMRPTMEERREAPTDDLISLLWKTELDGKPTDMEDMEDYGVMLFIAGLDTVMNGMGIGVRHLAMNPDLQDRLRADPTLIANATEEMLRRFTFTVPTRRVTKDVVFQGVEMKKGDVCDLFLPGADLDPTRFDQPETYDLGREAVHIAFGVGPHRCLGSHLARIELQIMYEELLATLPRFRLDPEKPPRFHGGAVMGPESVDLVWDVP